MRTKQGIKPELDEVILALESIENATMRMKLALREGDMTTAQEWHGRLESYVQSLYNSALHGEG